MKKITLEKLAEKLDAKLIGDGSIEITNLTSLDKAGASDITYAESEKYFARLEESDACAVVLHKEHEGCDKAQLVVENVEAAVIEVLNMFAPELTAPLKGVDPSAVIDPSAQIEGSASVGPNCTIAKNAVIGKNSVIGPNVYVGENSVVGENTKLDANVVIYHGCKIGNNCIVQSGTVVGALGFGYSFLDNQHKLIPHNGGVIIEDCVHVGANCCIDRAKFGNTTIGAGTKMDNLIQVGHGTVIGKCCIIVSHVGLAGSVEIGNGVIIGGQVGIANLVKVGDRTRIGAKSGIMSDVPGGKDVLGSPAVDVKDAIRQMMAMQKLPDALKKIKQLTKRIDKLESSANNS